MKNVLVISKRHKEKQEMDSKNSRRRKFYEI